jgi:hypothetical protein
MRSQDKSRAVAEGVLDGGQGLADARVIHYASIIEWNVEVDAHKNTVAVEGKITNR